MLVRLAPTRRAGLLAIAALLPLLSVFLPIQPASAVTTSYPLLYYPGQSINCYSMNVEGAPNGISTPPSQGVNESGCPPVGTSTSSDDPTYNIDSLHSAWDLGTYGWNSSDWGQTPGYSFSLTPTGSDNMQTVTMTNDASANCNLHETNIGYTYVDDDFRPGPDDQDLNMSEGGVNVSYNASVHQTGGWNCAQKRAILTTDFILQDPHNGPNNPDVLSVVHYDPGTFQPVQANGVQWDNAYDDLSGGECGDGCRVMIHDNTQMADSSTTAITDDFGQLFQTYKSYIDPWGLPDSDFILRGVQIVSSNIGSDTTSTVSDVQASFTPKQGTTLNGSISYDTAGSNGSTLCLDDYGNNRSYPATADVWPCTSGDNAQIFTYGWDHTLQVDGLCLDATGGSTAPGTPVALWQCNGQDNQEFIPGRWGEIWVPNTNPQTCLAVKNGTGDTTPGYSSLDLQTCTGQPNEHWTITG